MAGDEKKEKLELVSEENKNLRLKVSSIEDNSRTLKKQLKTLQAQIEQNSELASTLETLKQDLVFAKNQAKLKEQDHQETKASISNLQRAMASQAEEFNHQKRAKEHEIIK